MPDTAHQATHTPLKQLSATHLRVLALLANGDSFEVIGTALHLQAATVNYHLQRLRATFGVQSTNTLIALAAVYGLIVADGTFFEPGALLDASLPLGVKRSQ